MHDIHPALRDLLETARTDPMRNLDVGFRKSPIDLAAQLYCERRKRESWFDAGLFWEPSWDLLLYLYDAHQAGQDSVTIKSISKAPFTVSDDSTARWLDLLIGKGYVVTADGLKAVALTTKATAAIGGYLSSIDQR